MISTYPSSCLHRDPANEHLAGICPEVSGTVGEAGNALPEHSCRSCGWGGFAVVGCEAAHRVVVVIDRGRDCVVCAASGLLLRVVSDAMIPRHRIELPHRHRTCCYVSIVARDRNGQGSRV